MPKIDDLEPLLAAPAEALDVEFKGWLDLRGNDEHKGLLAKAAIALANEGGGVIVIGYREERPALISEPRPAEIAAYDADLINNIIRRFASPSFHCALTLLSDGRTGNEHAVVEVPGGFGFPVMSKSGTPGNTIRPHLCYIRKPGPESAPPENQADWERLLARCLRNRREDMLDAIRNIVLGTAAGAPAAPSAAEIQDTFVAAARTAWETAVKDLPSDAAARCPLGRYELDYALLGDFARPSLAELREKLRLAVAHRSGWPEFWVPTRDEIKPRALDGTIQCWLGALEMGERDPGHVDFWRASPEGRMFLLRGYVEDAGGWPDHRIEPGTIFDIRVSVWRVAECLDHARILGSLLAPDQEQLSVLVRARWYGLAGRQLSSLDPMQAFFMRDGYASRQKEFACATTVDVGQITDNLPEIIHPLLAPLSELFDFFELTMDDVRQILAKRRS
jgi:transcriptional regulator with XRE-family HTH domain